jgi:hypothetical protein
MSSLQNKLYNYEQTPPEKVWGKITAALDESNLEDKFPSTLYNSETVPPFSAWDKITSALDAEPGTIIPVTRRGFPFFRYAAAAAVIGIIAFGIMKWTGNSSKVKAGSEDIANTKKTDAPDNTQTTNPNENDIAESPAKEDNAAIEKNAAEVNTGETKTTRTKKVKPGYAITENIDETEPIYAYNEYTPPNLADRYVMLMTPNGIIRMSKKLGNIVCCVAGEEQDDDCKDQLKKWQEKIAASPIAPAPGNFMDILSLVSSLSGDEL